jgi:hypothetical protein
MKINVEFIIFTTFSTLIIHGSERYKWIQVVQTVSEFAKQHLVFDTLETKCESCDVEIYPRI